MAPMTRVKLVDPDGGGFWERHEDHPKGEVYVYGPRSFPVALTTEVSRAIARKLLVEVPAPALNPALTATWPIPTIPGPDWPHPLGFRSEALPVPSVPVGPAGSVGGDPANLPPAFYVGMTDGEVWQTPDGKPLLFVPGEELDGSVWERSDTSRAATDAEVENGMRASEYVQEGEGTQAGEPAPLSQLPDDILSLLLDAGFANLSDVQTAPDETLLAITGIGPARLAIIRSIAPRGFPGGDASP